MSPFAISSYEGQPLTHPLTLPVPTRALAVLKLYYYFMFLIATYCRQLRFLILMLNKYDIIPEFFE